uniref:Addiction module toxin RelE n=1 Tax=Moorena producens (strain JHB) TaxID=1454205 RepID=A0A1D9G7Q9_MOOP1
MEASDKFKRSLKKLAKVHGNGFVELVTQVLEDLRKDPYPRNSHQEPLPKKSKLPQGWTFHKLEFRFAKGASGQIRLMYLVNTTTSVIKLVWIYTHQKFDKRPDEKALKSVIQVILED